MKNRLFCANTVRFTVLGTLCFLCVGALIFMAPPTAAQSDSAAGLSLETTAFKMGHEIPEKFTCSGENVSPALVWGALPSGAKSLALILEDPDAPGGTFVHWVVFNLPGNARALPEGAGRHGDRIRGAGPQGGGMQGHNDFNQLGYNGPCPPPGKAHRYFFRLFALDSMLSLQPGSATGKAELTEAIKGHTLARAELMGTYRR